MREGEVGVWRYMQVGGIDGHTHGRAIGMAHMDVWVPGVGGLLQGCCGQAAQDKAICE